MAGKTCSSVGEALRKGTVAGIVPPTTKNELEVHERIVQQAGPFRGMEVRRDNRPGAPANQFLIWPTGEGASGSYVLSAARIGNETNRVAFTILHSNAGLSNTEVPKQKGAGREILPDLTPSRDSKREPDSTSLAQGSPANQLKQMERKRGG